MNGAALQVESLSVRYGEATALAGISLSARPGEFLLLTGPSGSGKSTLLRCCNGLIPQVWPAQVAGRIEVGGLDARGHAVAELARRVGFVFQSPEAQLFNLTVHDEVRFAPRQQGLSHDEVERRAREALDAVGISHLEQRRVATLSGGEKQRVAIASVLALQPSVLLLDEPTAHLDVPGARMVLGTVERLCRQAGLLVVMGEHRTGAAGRLADRLVILEQGRMVADGALREVFAQRALMRRLGVRRPSNEPEQPWESLIGPAAPAAGLPPVAELRGVHAGYGKTRVLRGVDLAVRPGEITALVGDNGAGKSTVARLLAGLMAPEKGEVLVQGRKPRPGEGAGLVLENPLTQVFCDTVEEEVTFGLANLGRADAGAVREALATCDLLSLRNRRIQRLSCGEQQRTVVASVMALGPSLLILDEPTRGQDWGHLAQLMSQVRRAAASGKAAVLITHDYKLVHRYADRVVLLRDGKVAADGRLRNGCEHRVPLPSEAGLIATQTA